MSNIQNMLGYPTSYSGLGNIANSTFTTTNPAPIEREHKIEVPVIEKGDRAGIFLKGEHGELIHITSERLYQMAGVEW